MLRPRLPLTFALGRLSVWKDTSTDGRESYKPCAAKSWPSSEGSCPPKLYGTIEARTYPALPGSSRGRRIAGLSSPA